MEELKPAGVLTRLEMEEKCERVANCALSFLTS